MVHYLMFFWCSGFTSTKKPFVSHPTRELWKYYIFLSSFVRPTTSNIVPEMCACGVVWNKRRLLFIIFHLVTIQVEIYFLKKILLFFCCYRKALIYHKLCLDGENFFGYDDVDDDDGVKEYLFFFYYTTILSLVVNERKALKTIEKEMKIVKNLSWIVSRFSRCEIRMKFFSLRFFVFVSTTSSF